MPNLVFNLREDVEDFFNYSGVFEAGTVESAPFLVFINEGDTVTVHDVYDIPTLLEYPDATPAVGMWRRYSPLSISTSLSANSSDIAKRNRRLRTARNVLLLPEAANLKWD
jgi:hypothetical protein